MTKRDAQTRLMAAIQAQDLSAFIQAIDDGARVERSPEGKSCAPEHSMIGMAVRHTLLAGNHHFIHGLASGGVDVGPALAACVDLPRDYEQIPWDSRVLETLLRYWPGDRAYWNQGLTPNGDTLMHRLSEQGREACLEVMLRYGLDPQVRTGRGRTPLHLANKTSTVFTLIKGGARTDVVDDARLSPVGLAVDRLLSASRQRPKKGQQAAIWDELIVVQAHLEHMNLLDDPRAALLARRILRAIKRPNNAPKKSVDEVREHAQLVMSYETRCKLERHVVTNAEVRARPTGRM